MDNIEILNAYKYLLSLDIPMQTIPSTQPVSDGSRGKTIEWMSSVCSYFEFENAVLHLSVSILDKYLALRAITANLLQLLASACILISCKYENVSTPNVSWFVNSMEESATTKKIC